MTDEKEERCSVAPATATLAGTPELGTAYFLLWRQQMRLLGCIALLLPAVAAGPAVNPSRVDFSLVSGLVPGAPSPASRRFKALR